MREEKYREGELNKGVKEARNSYGVVEDKWEPHHTWPPGANFMSQALHTSIADKLRLLSESEAEATIRSHSRGHRSKRAMSAAAGSTLGLTVHKVDAHLRVDDQGYASQDSQTLINVSLTHSVLYDANSDSPFEPQDEVAVS